MPWLTPRAFRPATDITDVPGQNIQQLSEACPSGSVTMLLWNARRFWGLPSQAADVDGRHHTSRRARRQSL